MNIANGLQDPLFAGFFSLSDAVHLLDVPNERKLKAWLNGWRGSTQPAVIKRDFANSGTISFLDLMELRFVRHFRDQGVSLRVLRNAAAKARQEWNVPHPFALSKLRFMTDRRQIFAQIAEEQDDRKTWNLATGQLEIWEALETAVSHNVVFDQTTFLARAWTPRAEFSNVIVDPRIAFGQPSIKDHGIPTRILHKQWLTERSLEKVAKWFEIDVPSIEEAIRFEESIAA